MTHQACRTHHEADIWTGGERRIEALFTLRAAPALVVLVVLALLAAQFLLPSAGV